MGEVLQAPEGPCWAQKVPARPKKSLLACCLHAVGLQEQRAGAAWQ